MLLDQPQQSGPKKYYEEKNIRSCVDTLERWTSVI